MSHDMALNDSYALWCKRLFAEHPERRTATDGESHFGAFCAGWHYRYETAASRVGLRDDTDLAVIHGHLNWLESEHRRAWDQVMKSHYQAAGYRRILASQREQIVALKGDPIEAPAYKRIANQRREIKRLTQELHALRGSLSEEPGA